VQVHKPMACVESSYNNQHGLRKSAISALQGIRRFSSIPDVSLQGTASRSLTGKSEMYKVLLIPTARQYLLQEMRSRKVSHLS